MISLRLPSARGQRGQTLVMVAAMLPLLLGVTGLAVDVGLLYHHKRRMQTAADAGALAGAHEAWRNRLTSVVSLGRAQADLNGFTHNGTDTVVNIYHPPTTGFYIGNTRYVEAQITQPSPTWFMQLFGWTDVDISARAVAGAGANGQHCIYALDPGVADAFHAGSSVRLEANCGVVVNSTDASAMHTTSSANLAASVIDVSGGFWRESSSVVTPAPNTGMLPDPDPLAYMSPPDASGSCDHTNWTRDNNTHTLNPGIYCNGIRIVSNGVVNLNPGIYIMRGGGLTLESNAILRGEGVTFYLTGNSTYPYKGLDWQSSTQVRLKAPTTGPYAGILFFQDRSMPSTAINYIRSSNNSYLEGALYFPTQMLQVESSTTSEAAYTLLIARMIRMESSAYLRVNNNYSSLAAGSPLKKLTLVE